MARNDYLLNVAAVNAHQQRYYATDLPELIAVSAAALQIIVYLSSIFHFRQAALAHRRISDDITA